MNDVDAFSAVLLEEEVVSAEIEADTSATEVETINTIKTIVAILIIIAVGTMGPRTM